MMGSVVQTMQKGKSYSYMSIMKNTAKCSYYLFKAILVSLAAYKTALLQFKWNFD